MVRGRYDNPIEEHLGISNRNQRRVGLDAAKALYLGDIEYSFIPYRQSEPYVNQGGTAEAMPFVPLFLGMMGIFYFNFLAFGG